MPQLSLKYMFQLLLIIVVKTLEFQFRQVNYLLEKETKQNTNNTVEKNRIKSKIHNSQSPGHSFKLSNLLAILEKTSKQTHKQTHK